MGTWLLVYAPLDTDVHDAEFVGFQSDEIHNLLWAGGEEDITLDDVMAWLEIDETDPWYHSTTVKEIVADVTAARDSSTSETDD